MELDDDYVLKNERRNLLKKLLRLPLSVLCHLVTHWASKYGTANNVDLETLTFNMQTLEKRKVKRRLLGMKILLEYWPNGLSLYQLAQIDCYTLVYKPKLYLWNSSTAWNAKNERQVLHTNFDKFTMNLREDLQKFYLSNIHIFEHPDLPLMICRVQLFDRNNSFLTSFPTVKESTNLGSSLTSNDKSVGVETASDHQLISRSPYYIAFALNSPNIIHSPDDDSYAQLILQSVQKTLSDREPIVLKVNQTNPVRSLEAMQVLQGVSQFSSSLGPWSTYAQTSFEISPLDSIEKHQCVKGKRVLIDDDTSDNEDSQEIKRLRLERNMIRFKGSRKGIEARKAYEVRKINARIHNPDKESSSWGDQLKSITKYTSLVPVEKVSFTATKGLTNSQKQISLKFKFRGKDIFGGLHELCDKRLIDSSRVPGWLAGENGVDSGTIIDGDFVKEIKRGGLL